MENNIRTEIIELFMKTHGQLVDIAHLTGDERKTQVISRLLKEHFVDLQIRLIELIEKTYSRSFDEDRPTKLVRRMNRKHENNGISSSAEGSAQ